MVQPVRRKANGEGLGSGYNSNRPGVESNASINRDSTSLEADAQVTNRHGSHKSGMRHGGESRMGEVARRNLNDKHFKESLHSRGGVLKQRTELASVDNAHSRTLFMTCL